jgi:hypothetical protein
MDIPTNNKVREILFNRVVLEIDFVFSGELVVGDKERM